MLPNFSSLDVKAVEQAKAQIKRLYTKQNEELLFY